MLNTESMFIEDQQCISVQSFYAKKTMKNVENRRITLVHIYNILSFQ